MNTLCTSCRIINSQKPEQGISQIVNAGFKNIFLDLSAYISAKQLEVYGISGAVNQMVLAGQEEGRHNQETLFLENQEEYGNFLLSLCRQCCEAGLQFPIVQAPYLSRNTQRNDLQKLLFNFTQISIESCGKAGCDAVIVKPLFAGIRNEDIWSVNRVYYLSLAKTAEKYGIVILLENQCKNWNERLVRGICAEAEEAVAWVDRLNEEVGEKRFGFCLDIGTCSICGQNIYDFICCLGNRIKAVRIRDCDGYRDASLLPFTCVVQGSLQTDWRGLILALRETAFDGSLIFDYTDMLSGFSPLLRSKLLEMAKSVGDFFAWQVGMQRSIQKYEQLVLFGAGNMCRNYMKYYGKRKRPLFTCDNNHKLWGTKFCGLEVSSPERLKSIPNDCAILICNTFYREIAKQLRKMELNNPIVYFNDEYLPMEKINA